MEIIRGSKVYLKKNIKRMKSNKCCFPFGKIPMRIYWTQPFYCWYCTCTSEPISCIIDIDCVRPYVRTCVRVCVAIMKSTFVLGRTPSHNIHHVFVIHSKTSRKMKINPFFEFDGILTKQTTTIVKISGNIKHINIVKIVKVPAPKELI